MVDVFSYLVLFGTTENKHEIQNDISLIIIWFKKKNFNESYYNPNFVKFRFYE